MIIFLKIIFFLFFVIFFFYSFPILHKKRIKDAPFLPTPKEIIRKSLKAVNPKPNEILCDLGCGNGRVLVIGAKEFKLKVIGIEDSFLFFYFSKMNLFLNNIKNGQIKKENIYNINIKNIDILYLFLNPPMLKKIEHKIKSEGKKGLRVIVFSSPFPNLKPKEIIPVKKGKNNINIYLYVKEQKIKKEPGSFLI